jgi:hypothetical protein
MYYNYVSVIIIGKTLVGGIGSVSSNLSECLVFIVSFVQMCQKPTLLVSYYHVLFYSDTSS